MKFNRSSDRGEVETEGEKMTVGMDHGIQTGARWMIVYMAGSESLMG